MCIWCVLLFGVGWGVEGVLVVGKVGGGAGVAEGEFEEVFGGGEEGNVGRCLVMSLGWISLMA